MPNTRKKPTVHIAYCTDKNYIEYVAISLVSILLNNRNLAIQFHVFVDDVPDEDLSKLQSLSENILIHKIDSTELDKYKNQFSIKHLNRSIYIRLLVPRLLQNYCNQFLYLDADILCFGTIEDIAQINIDEYIAAVSRDALNPIKDENSKRLGLDNNFYFNSGVLYINIPKWIKNDIEEKANVLLIENADSFKYPDQDALNILLQNKVKEISPDWNKIINWMSIEEQENFFFNKEELPKFIHYTGGRKPWFQEHTGLSQDLLLFYKHFTPWASAPLKSYKSKMKTSDYRVYSRIAFQKKFYLKACGLYLTYIFEKLKRAHRQN